MRYNARTFYIVWAIFLAIAYGGIVFGQEYDVTTEDGTPLTGEGFAGVPPSYLNLVKVESRHSGDFIGSGSFISDRLVLTCGHNVRGLRKSDRVGIHTTSGRVYWDTRVTHKSERYDLALIYIDDEKVDYHRILRVQDTVYSLRDVSLMGFQPSKNALTIYGGVPTGKRHGRRGVRGPVTFETTCSIFQGMSGGPMVDGSLELVGVGITGNGELSDVVMLSRIHEFLDSYTGPRGNLVDPWEWLPFRPNDDQ